MQEDTISLFEYKDSEEATPNPFNLTALTSVANKLFSQKRCVLEKLAEGGFHKVYNVKKENGDELGFVARVACPCFPKDKLESEVATLKYIAEKTLIPVPKVIAWNSDAFNEVGAEYVFLSKVPGVSSHKVWDEMPLEAKKRTVRQVASHIYKLWELRFDSLGSLYLTGDESGYRIGPIIEKFFYKTLDGVPRTKVPVDLNEFRGPFPTISSYLASGLHAELKLYSERHEDLVKEAGGDNNIVESGAKAMRLALGLCSIYPGERPITNDVKEPFSLKLDDFTQSNIMIDPSTGDVTALIDFESVTTAPGWYCAEIPPWLRDEDMDLIAYFSSIKEYSSGEEERDVGSYVGTIERIKARPPTEEAILQKEFLMVMSDLDSDGSWNRAYEMGEPYREFAESVRYFLTFWGRHARGRWVESALRWLKKHPDEPTPGNLEFRYPDIKDSWVPYPHRS